MRCFPPKARQSAKQSLQDIERQLQDKNERKLKPPTIKVGENPDRVLVSSRDKLFRAFVGFPKAWSLDDGDPAIG